VVVGEMQTGQFFGKLLLELAPIVGQHESHGKRENLDAKFEEFRGGERGMRGGAQRKSNSRKDVLKGDDVSAYSMSDLLKGIKRDTMSGE